MFLLLTLSRWMQAVLALLWCLHWNSKQIQPTNITFLLLTFNKQLPLFMLHQKIYEGLSSYRRIFWGNIKEHFFWHKKVTFFQNILNSEHREKIHGHALSMLCIVWGKLFEKDNKTSLMKLQGEKISLLKQNSIQPGWSGTKYGPSVFFLHNIGITSKRILFFLRFYWTFPC